MPDIFISYSREDQPFVSHLSDELRRLDVRGFMDTMDIAAGADFSQQIHEAIARADAVVVVMSPSAFRSNWVMMELGLAESLDKKIIPVLAPGNRLDESMPELLSSYTVLASSDRSIGDTAAHIVAALKDIPVEKAQIYLTSGSRRRWLIIGILLLSLFVLLVLSLWWRAT